MELSIALLLILEGEAVLKTTFETSLQCHAPWRSLYIQPDGNVYVDNQSSHLIGNLPSSRLDEILTGNSLAQLQQQFLQGTFPTSCNNCKKKENTIGHSRRIFFQHKLLPLDQTQAKFQLEYLDLNLTNRCNLKCRMCNSESSASWIAEDIALTESSPIDLRRPKAPQVLQVQPELVNKLLSNTDLFQNLRYLALRGGEPLMEPIYLSILDFFIKQGFSNQITLDISTNGTVTDPKILGRINQFRNIDFHLSIEASGELYKYIRGGNNFSIDDLQEKIRIIRSFGIPIIFAVTVSIYNIIHLDKLILWFLKHKSINDEIILSNAVVRPDYLQYQNIPRPLRLLAKEKLSKVLEPIEEHCRLPERRIRNSGIQEIITGLQSPDTDERLELWKTFIEFNQRLDVMRKTSIVEIIPEFKNFYQLNVGSPS
jgi:MoaA/NifB/PqqE/SkfB family radical SAM enzyme